MKTKIEISDIEHELELFSIEKGKITEIKLDDELFSKNDGPGSTISHEKPGDLVEKDEQKAPISEQITEKKAIAINNILEVTKKLETGELDKENFRKSLITKKSETKSKNIKNLKSRRWSKKEDQILIDNQNLTIAEIIKLGLFPNRTRASILGRISRLENKGSIKKKYKVKKHGPGPTISNEKSEKPIIKEEKPVNEIIEEHDKNVHSDKPTVSFVNPDSTQVKGFEEHRKKRIKELSERKKNFPGLVKG